MIDSIVFETGDLKAMNPSFRRNLINCLSGFKGANLIGSINKDGGTNLAIFNSVMHIGANPALMGFVLRPLTEQRHTYNNILETRYYTINSVQYHFMKQAHQTSAKFPENLSEFTEVGLAEEFKLNFAAPFVKESKIKMGLELVETIPIKSNGCMLIIGEVLHIDIPEAVVAADGFVDLQQAQVLSILGLDAYYATQLVGRMDYARPGIPLKELSLS